MDRTDRYQNDLKCCNYAVNDLPKVVTRQRCGQKLNSQPSSCKSNALTTRLPSYRSVAIMQRKH